MSKKYELVKEYTIQVGDKELYRIKAVKSFGIVCKGELGGYIEKEDNLSHEGLCWIAGNARVYGDARVYGGEWKKSPLHIQGSKWFVAMASPSVLRIGCESHDLDWWLENYEEVARKHKLDKETKAEYLAYVKLANELYGKGV